MNAKTVFWIATIIIFMLFGLLPAFTTHTEPAKQSIAHLGYPEYFGYMLAFFKVFGSLAIIIPQVPARIKEWAYAGIGFDIISAFISNTVVDGLNMSALFTVFIFAVLAASYICYHKLNAQNQ